MSQEYRMEDAEIFYSEDRECIIIRINGEDEFYTKEEFVSSFGEENLP